MKDSSKPTTALFLWNVPPLVRARIEEGARSERDHLRLLFPEDTQEESFLRLAPDADVIVGWRPTDRVLDAATRARWIVNPGAGVQHIVDRLREKNTVRRVPLSLANGHGNAYATAQGAFALLLALTDRIVEHH